MSTSLPEVGGLESHVYYLARALVNRGHRVQVVTSRSLPGVAKEEDMDGIQVFRTWFPSRSPVGWVAHALGSVPKTRELAGSGPDPRPGLRLGPSGCWRGVVAPEPLWWRPFTPPTS